MLIGSCATRNQQLTTPNKAAIALSLTRLPYLNYPLHLPLLLHPLNTMFCPS